MTDILIRRNHVSALVHSRSEFGEAWLAENVKANSSGEITIPMDVVDEFAEDLRKEGLEVDII